MENFNYKEGDLCWLWNKEDKIPRIGHFSKLIDGLGRDCDIYNKYKKFVSSDAFYTEYTQEDFLNPGSTSSYFESFEFDFCEPYIVCQKPSLLN